MPLFHIIEDGFAIIQSRGVFRQSKLFSRDGRLYAAYGGGFVGLSTKGGTTAPAISWLEVEIPGHPLITRDTSAKTDQLGRLASPHQTKQIEHEESR